MSTNIEWARNPDGSKGETWPVCTGCTPVSEGCRNCYAARMTATRLKHHPRYAGLAVFENGKARWTGEVGLNYDVLEQPLHWKKPRMIFVASMSDLFHENVPMPFIADIWDIMAEAHQHTFQVLTKRTDRLPEVFHYLAKWKNYKTPLPNVWLGTSVENQEQFDSRWYWASQIPAAVLFVSCEPLLGSIRFDARAWEHLPDWVICGGESGPGARPMHPDWARSLRNQCYAANVPFFFKQRGAWTWWDFGNPIPRVARHVFDNGLTVFRVGKKRAGRLLDGRAWDEMPKEATCS